MHFKCNIYSAFYNSLLPSLFLEYEASVGTLQQQLDFYKVRLGENITFCVVFVPLNMTVD
jgi:hypothetical protein